jgi:hypothetical protein
MGAQSVTGASVIFQPQPCCVRFEARQGQARECRCTAGLDAPWACINEDCNLYTGDYGANQVRADMWRSYVLVMRRLGNGG